MVERPPPKRKVVGSSPMSVVLFWSYVVSVMLIVGYFEILGQEVWKKFTYYNPTSSHKDCQN